MADSSRKKKNETAEIENVEVPFLKLLLAGAVAGGCAKTTVAPIDRVKILMQAHHKHYVNSGVISTLCKIYANDGFAGLFKGNGAQMIRIVPYAAVQFATYEKYKQLLSVEFGPGKLCSLTAGSLAGMTAVFMTYPMDLIRANLAFQASGEIIYTGIGNAIKVIFYQEGVIRGLYKGIVPTLIGMVPYAGLSFCGFETLKVYLLETCPEWCGRPCPRQDGQLVLTYPAKLLCGGLAGAMAQTIPYPLDVVRRRMQLRTILHHGRPPDARPPLAWYTILQLVFKKHGIKRGLFRGISVNYIKVTPMVAVSFTVYEFMKDKLGIDVHATGR